MASPAACVVTGWPQSAKGQQPARIAGGGASGARSWSDLPGSAARSKPSRPVQALTIRSPDTPDRAHALRVSTVTFACAATSL